MMERMLHAFLHDLTAERMLSAQTIVSYKRDLLDFLRHMETLGLTHWKQVETRHVKAYMLQLKKRGKSPATINRRLSSIRSLYKFLLRERMVRMDPSLHIDGLKQVQKKPSIIEREDMERLLNAPDTSTAVGSRDKAMLELLYATGMRVSELIALNTDSVDLQMEYIRIVGKKDKERIVPLHRLAVHCLEQYLSSARDQLMKQGTDEKALFLNHLGFRLSRQGFWKIIKKYAAEVIEGEVTPHMLRHSFAMHLIENGADLHAVQELLGHVDVSSTHVYVQASNERLKDIYNQYQPRDMYKYGSKKDNSGGRI